MPDDRLYYRLRSEQERQQAEASPDEAARRIHLSLAAEYDRRAEAVPDARVSVPA